MRPDRGAARRRIARPGSGQSRAQTLLGGQRRHLVEPSLDRADNADPGARKGAAAPRRRHGRAARSRRAAPPLPRPPRSAISSSSAASQAGSAAALAQQPRAFAHRLLIAADPRRVRRIDAEDEPVHKAPPASGPSINSRSICGVSHSTPSRSASADWLRTGSPSMRIARRSPPIAVPARPDPDGAMSRRHRRGDGPSRRDRLGGSRRGGRYRRAAHCADRGRATGTTSPRAGSSCRRRSVR